MADLSEVQDAIRDLCTPLVYPNGTLQPSIVNAPVKVYSGYPKPKNLDDDLSNGITHINIFAENKERNTTRFLHEYENIDAPVPTIVLTVTNNQVLVSGVNIPTTYQFCTIIVNNITYSYEVQQTDTLASIAINLAAIIPTANAFGNLITIANAYKIVARVGVKTTVRYESKRQEKCFMVQIWAPDFTKRDVLGKALDTYLPTYYHLELYDQIAKMIFAGSHQVDESEKQILYRRILYFNVEYSTNYEIPATLITSTQVNVSEEN